jgi:hypothetical protein
LKKTLNEADWLALLRALAARAERGLERLEHLERLHRKARTAIAESYRPGALPSLLALTLHQPVLSPQAVARLLDLTVTGASKLLERAAGTGLLTEITTRRTWRIFMSVDLAVEFGFAKAPLGRPRVERFLPRHREIWRLSSINSTRRWLRSMSFSTPDKANPAWITSGPRRLVCDIRLRI